MTVLLMAATSMVLALLFFWLSARSRKRTGIPAGEVFYQDLVGTAISSPGPAVTEAGYLRETGLFDPNRRRGRAGRT